MESGKQLLEQAVRDLAASAKTSRTAAGQAEPSQAHLIDAINQVFALFRLNYHNQYYSAFGETEQLNQIKKLWLDSLGGQPVEVILLAAKRCIETSEYLPTLHRFLSCCREVRLHDAGLPDVHAAYREACLATEPKYAFPWTHPAVFHAGQQAGWFYLASTTEDKAFPIFKRYYETLCDQLADGATLALPAPDTGAASHPKTPAVPAEEQREHLAQLRQQTGL